MPHDATSGAGGTTTCAAAPQTDRTSDSAPLTHEERQKKAPPMRGSRRTNATSGRRDVYVVERVSAVAAALPVAQLEHGLAEDSQEARVFAQRSRLTRARLCQFDKRTRQRAAFSRCFCERLLPSHFHRLPVWRAVFARRAGGGRHYKHARHAGCTRPHPLERLRASTPPPPLLIKSDRRIPCHRRERKLARKPATSSESPSQTSSPGKPGLQKPRRSASRAHDTMALRFSSDLTWWNHTMRRENVRDEPPATAATAAAPPASTRCADAE